MHHSDSTLAEDFDWALFPEPTPVSPLKRWLYRLEVASFVVLTWFVYQPLAVVLACLAISFQEFRKAHVASRAIPDRAAAWICSPRPAAGSPPLPGIATSVSGTRRRPPPSQVHNDVGASPAATAQHATSRSHW